MNTQKENADKDQPVTIKGIRLSAMNIVMIIGSCILSLLLTATVVRVSKTLKNTYHSVGEYVSSIQHGMDILNSVDYFTEQVQFYALTEDPAYMERYFSELNNVYSQENAIKDIEKYRMDEDAYNYIHAALQNSDLLKTQEIYAMRLLTEAWDCDPALIPQEVKSTRLAPEDTNLSEYELVEKAQSMIFGMEYQNLRIQVIDLTEQFKSSMSAATKRMMEQDYSQLSKAVVVHQVLIGIQFFATVAGFAFSFVLVVLPMGRFVKSIAAGKSLNAIGAYECRCLAQTCNTMFARNAAHEHTLRHQAEHDALTGLLNRGAFDNLRQTLHGPEHPLGLLIIDVDKFKQVNDGFGHEMGDRILKRVASLLTDNFRSTDYPARIGGDEFSIILTDTSQEQQKTIEEKIKAINQILTHPTDDAPVVSLSVGGAFSTEGFTDDLYRRADLALYAVKNHGRCGCRFYDDTLGDNMDMA